MTLLPEIRNEIAAAARQRAGHRAQGPATARSWRPSIGSLGIAASIVVVGAVLAVILLHAHHGSPGVSGGQSAGTPPLSWGELAGRAANQTRQHDPACRPRRRTGPSPARHDAPPPSLSVPLAVLRHPAPPDQRISAKRLAHVIGPRPARGVYINYVHSGTLDDVSYYLIPAANVTQVYPVPARCSREQLHAFRTLAHDRPPAQRAALVRYEANWLKSPQASLKPTPGVCLIYHGRFSGGGEGCTTAATLRRAPESLYVGVGSSGNDHETVTLMIVPNNVATATAHYNAQTRPGAVPHPITTTHHITNNVAIFDLQGAWDPPNKITYRSANGTILWTSQNPSRP